MTTLAIHCPDCFSSSARTCVCDADTDNGRRRDTLLTVDDAVRGLNIHDPRYPEWVENVCPDCGGALDSDHYPACVCYDDPRAHEEV